MAELRASEAAAGTGLPLAHGACRLSALAVGRCTMIAPFPGHMAAADAALASLGLSFPAPGKVLSAPGARITWAGREQAMLLGAAPPAALADHAAVSDQGDGWAGFMLAGSGEGRGAESVLARLVPLDLRARSFPPGRAARSLLNHMPLLILRDAADAFELYTFRSMARSAVHELAEAMRSVSARKAL